MRSRIVLSVFCFIVIQYAVLSQEKDFKLSDYKLPDINYNELEFDFNLSRSGSSQKIRDFSSIKYLQSDKESQAFVELSYMNFRNAERYQGQIKAYISYDNELYKEDFETDPYFYEDSYYDKSTSFQSVLETENRIYFNKYFLEVNPLVSYVSIIQNVTDPRELVNSLIKNGYNEFRASIPVSFGYGRLEPVQDARLAIYILEELVDKGSLAEMPSRDKIFAFAKKISEHKNSRYFDTRLRDIEDMKEITRFLRDSGIIVNEDIVFYTVLRDLWDYASLPLRLSGLSISAGLDNSYSDILDFNDGIEFGVPNDERETARKLSYYGFFLDLKYHKPHTLYLQSDAYLRIGRNYIHLESDVDYTDDFLANYNSKMLDLAIGYKLSYIPDSRTLISFNIEAENISEDITPDRIPGYPEGSRLDSKIYGFDSNLLISYYISPRFRLSLRGRVSSMPEKVYIQNTEDNHERISRRFTDYSFGMGMIYKLF